MRSTSAHPIHRPKDCIVVDGGLPASPIPKVDGGTFEIHPFTVYPQPLRNHSYDADPAGISPMLLADRFDTSLPRLAMWALGLGVKEEDLLYLHAAGEQAAAAWLEKQTHL